MSLNFMVLLVVGFSTRGLWILKLNLLYLFLEKSPSFCVVLQQACRHPRTQRWRTARQAESSAKWKNEIALIYFFILVRSKVFPKQKRG